jgi:dethiobiotin synthase
MSINYSIDLLENNLENNLESINSVFVTGIGTNVGKTFVCERLVTDWKGDYFKPIQTGPSEDHDALKVALYADQHGHNEKMIYPPVYCFERPISPHFAAAEAGVKIDLAAIQLPEKRKGFGPIVVEGAGGVMAPINDHQTNLDLMVHLNIPVILVVHHYLGSLNHTFMSVEVLKAKGLRVLGFMMNRFGNYEMGLESELTLTQRFHLPILGVFNHGDE